MSGPGRGQYDRVGSENDPFTLQELSRKINNTIRYGTIEKIDHKKARCRIKIGPLSSAWIPWHTAHAGQDATWAPPSAGEQVTVFCPGGNLAQAVIQGGLYQKKFPAPGDNKDTRVHKIKDGTMITHDTKKKTRTTQMPKDGEHTIGVDKQLQQVDAKGTRLKNDKGTVHLHSNGTIQKSNDKGSIVIDPGGKIVQTSNNSANLVLDGGSAFLNC